MQVKGSITYNGATFKEFIPERTAAYVTQYDEVSCFGMSTPRWLIWIAHTDWKPDQ